MTRFWMAVASKNHVKKGVQEGFAQACHGKAQPLRRMRVGDGIVYYSPKQEFGGDVPCQEFTAIGHVTGEDAYQYDMGNGFTPYRKDIDFHQEAEPVSIRPLIESLQFIEDKRRWGSKFRFGFFEIPKEDYDLISNVMLVNR